MYCIKCGREIPDEALFCSYCGTSDPGGKKKIRPQSESKNNTGSRTQKKTAVSQTGSGQQSEKPKGKASKTFVTLITAAIVYAVARYAVAPALVDNMKSDSASEKTSIPTPEIKLESSQTDTSADASGETDTSDEAGSSEDEFWSSTLWGGLYTNGTLTYGPASIKLTNYTHMAGEDIEGLEEADVSSDYLLSPKNDNVFYIRKNFEIQVSYEKSDEQGIVDSYTEDEKSTNVSMVEFEKSYLGSYPTILYSLKRTVDGEEEYATELIIFNGTNASSSIRLVMESLSEDARARTVASFKAATLAEKPLTYADTGVSGVSRIGVK